MPLEAIAVVVAPAESVSRAAVVMAVEGASGTVEGKTRGSVRVPVGREATE